MKCIQQAARGGGKIARLLVFAIATLAILGTSTGTSAASPTTTTVRPNPATPANNSQQYGGCRLIVICGTVFNNTPYYIEVCVNWAASGPEHDYQPANHCANDGYAYVAPFSIYGAPQLVDIDAIYIPAGYTYWGVYGPIPKKWTHTKSGWWKFANTTDVHIDLVT